VDEELYELMPKVGAPIHAWRMLGQLQANAAIPALMSVLQRWAMTKGGEWTNEIANCLSPDWAAAIQHWRLTWQTNVVFPRGTACGSIEQIGSEYLEHLSQCVTVLTNQLKARRERSGTRRLSGHLLLLASTRHGGAR